MNVLDIILKAKIILYLIILRTYLNYFNLYHMYKYILILLLN